MPPLQAPVKAPAQPIVASVPDGSSLAAFMSAAIGGPLLTQLAAEPGLAANAAAPAVAPPSAIATVDVSTVAATPAPPPDRSWQAEVGKTVQQTLDAWAQEAGWQPVKWQPDYDYVIEAQASFRGEFLDAANDLLSAYDAAKRKFRGLAYRDNKVLEVWEKK